MVMIFYDKMGGEEKMDIKYESFVVSPDYAHGSFAESKCDENHTWKGIFDDPFTPKGCSEERI